MSVKPWLVVGDFNELCFSWERKSGRIKGEWQMRNFREALQDCQLHDLGFCGAPYTFSNRRLGSEETKARLDRAMANVDWLSSFPKAQVRHMVTATSDHNLLSINFFGYQYCRSNKLFRFEPMWMRCSNFKDTVSQYWSEVDTEGKSLKSMLSNCAKKIVGRNKSQVGSVGGHLKNLRDKLEVNRQKTRTAETLTEEQIIQKDMDEWCLKEELIWKQRSHCDWLKEGDRNTRFFHSRASTRQKNNQI